MSDDGKIRPAKPPPDTSWLRTVEVRDGDRRREGQERDEEPSLMDEYFDPALLDGHGWVKRAAKDKAHECSPPMREVVYQTPAPPPPPKGWQGNEPGKGVRFTQTEVDGDYGDLWRCFCDRLWRIGKRCDACDYYGHHDRGQCIVGLAWRPASLWQRIRNWRRP